MITSYEQALVYLGKLYKMKKLLILPLAALLFACADEKQPDYAVLTGSLENFVEDEIRLYDYANTPTVIKISKDGKFTDTISLTTAGYYSLRVGRGGYMVYLAPGEVLNIDHNVALKDSKPSFTGSGSEENQFLVDKMAMQLDISGEMPVLFGKEESDFLQTITTVKTKQMEALNASLVSPEFKAIESKSIDYGYLENKGNYPQYHAHFAKKEGFEPSVDFLSDVKLVNFDNNEDAMKYASYRNLVVSNFYKGMESEDAPDAQQIDVAIQMIGEKESPAIMDILVSNSMFFFNANANDLAATRDALLAVTTGESLREKITTKYEKIKNLTKGNPSPTFNYENFKGGETALVDMKGKYVYIDVWATWCGPCIGEIPFLKKIEHEFADSNIEFVSISIDESRDYEAWRKMVGQKELGGTQLMSDNDWKSKFVKEYAIEGIPRFILLDPEGNIVSSDADRPSNKKLAETFKNLGL
ncbi:MAG: thiol-disulfide isomerase/thioredoxin [Flavobacteriales bacterium]